MCTAGEARTHGACVTSVLCTRVLVCSAQGSERGRGSGEAKPGARHASLCAFCCQQNAKRAYIRKSRGFSQISWLVCLLSLLGVAAQPILVNVWMVRVCTSEEQYHFREVPEMALRSVPRSIALSLELPVFASL